MRYFAFIIFVIVFFMSGENVYAWSGEDFYVHVVKKGDTLSHFVPRHQWLLVQKVNLVDVRHLVEGKTIFLPKNKSLSLDDLSAPVEVIAPQLTELERGIVVYLDKQYFGAYERGLLKYWGPVSSGKSDSTPHGTFSMLWKSKNYRSRKYDVPMPFAVCYDNEGYFFHQQSLSGRPTSHGCIRLLMEDAKRIYHWIQKKDPIIIL